MDSDIVIEVLRRRDAEIASRWIDLGASGALVVYSPVTAAEVWQGAWDREHGDIDAIFALMTAVPIDADIGRRAGHYLRLYRASHGLDLGDALIAATASIHGVPLWTRNRKHYPMKDVRLV